MIRKINFTIIFLLLVLIISSSLVNASVRVEPARIILSSKLGARSTGVINVINNGEEEVLLQAYLYDWLVDNQEGISILEPETLDSSLSNYIKFNPRSFILGPGEQQKVRFTIASPQDLDRELRGIVFFEREISYEEGTGARVLTQIGTVIYLIPENVEYGFKLKEARFSTKNDDGNQSCMLIMENIGKAHLRFILDYKIIDSNSKLIEESSITNKVLLPGYERGLVFNFNNQLASGDYKLLLNYSFLNNDRGASYEIPFSVE